MKLKYILTNNYIEKPSTIFKPLNNYIVFMFWTGDNKLTENRIKCLKQFKQISESSVIFITKDNLSKYILKSEPLHPAYKYLSETHRADYLRTYFMNFYGGGYSDIKKTTNSWKSSFDKLNNSDKWIIGYKWHSNKNNEDVIGNGSYICKPQTKLTIEWYNSVIQLLNSKLEELKKYPAKYPQDSFGVNNSKYPIRWEEMLACIFDPLCYEYKDKILNTLPINIFESYR